MVKKKGFKGIAVILMLVFLSNITFVSTGYASELSGSSVFSPNAVDYQIQSCNLKQLRSVPVDSLNLTEPTLTDKVYVEQNIYSPISSPPLLNPSNNVESKVYLDQPIQTRIDKEIEFPAIPDIPLPPDKKGWQSEGVHMKQVIHMPKVDEKPVPYTPIDNRVQNGRKPAKNVNNPGITKPTNGNTSLSPDSPVYSNLNEITIDKTDLNLVDDEAAEESLNTVINHIDSINSSVSGSVTDSMYGSVTNSIYNDLTVIDKLPSNPIDKNKTRVSGVDNASGNVHDSFPIHI